MSAASCLPSSVPPWRPSPRRPVPTANVNLSGLTKFAHIKVDGSHVFFTSGSGTTSILVTNYAGATVANITNEAGADGMALSPDRTTLYVALSGADAISVINTATLTETARYATGASTCPHAVALAGKQGLVQLRLLGWAPARSARSTPSTTRPR